MRNAGDEARLQVSFASSGSTDLSAVFSFGKNEIIELKPEKGMTGIRLFSPIEYSIVPGFVGDDLIFGPAEYASADTLCLPAENVFVGLQSGEGTALVMAWPNGNQRLSLHRSADPQDRAVIESVDFDNDEQSLYCAPLSARGI